MEDEKLEETVSEEVVEEKHKHGKTKKRSIFAKIMNLLALLLLIFVIYESVIAFIGFNAIRNDKEPENYLNIVESNDGITKTTTYNFGLYKVQKIEDSKKYSTKLLPFFLD